jgi:hypothetical protein
MPFVQNQYFSLGKPATVSLNSLSLRSSSKAFEGILARKLARKRDSGF